MNKKKITISYTAENDVAFYIETLIRSSAMKAIQDNGGKASRIEIENLLTENKNF